MRTHSRLATVVLAGTVTLVACQTVDGGGVGHSTAAVAPSLDSPSPMATASKWAAEAEALCAHALRTHPRSTVSPEDAMDTVARLAWESQALREAVPQKSPVGVSDEVVFFEEMQLYSDLATEVVRHLEEHPDDLHADEIAEGDPGWTDFSDDLSSLKLLSAELEAAAARIGARSCAALTLRF